MMNILLIDRAERLSSYSICIGPNTVLFSAAQMQLKIPIIGAITKMSLEAWTLIDFYHNLAGSRDTQDAINTMKF